MTLADKWNRMPALVRNAVYGFSTLIFPLSLSFVATPIIVGALGNAHYGILQLVLGFVSYSFNLSFGTALTKKLAEGGERQTEEERSDLVSAAVIASVAVAGAGAILIWLLNRALVDDLFVFGPGERAIAIDAFHLASALLVVTSLAQVLGSVLKGLQRFDVYSRIFNLQSILLVLGNIALAVLGYGVREMLVWTLLTQAIASLAAVIAIRGLMPGLRPSIFVGRRTYWVLGSFSAGVVGHQIAANLLLLFERGLITARFGPEQVGFYVVAMMFGILIHGMASSALLFLMPLASELETDKERLAILYRRITKVVSILVVLCATLLIANSKFALSVWMGSAFAEETWLIMALHTTTFALLAIRTVSWQMADGLGFPHYNFWIFLAGGGITFFLMLFSPNEMGTYGIAVARLAGFAVVVAGLFVIERLLLGRIFYGFWLGMSARLAAAGLITGLVSYELSGFVPWTWPGFAGVLAAGSVVFAGCVAVLGVLEKNEWQALRSRLGDLLQRG